MFEFITDLVGELIFAVIEGAIREYHLMAHKTPDKERVSDDENK